jgi:carbon monoxide dehydrogenase subunit G
MKLDQSFDVAAPIDDVWRALNDFRLVAPCLPVATLTGHDEDGTYRGEFKVKLGTIKTTAADEAHAATMVARGTDVRGQGAAPEELA